MRHSPTYSATYQILECALKWQFQPLLTWHYFTSDIMQKCYYHNVYYFKVIFNYIALQQSCLLYTAVSVLCWQLVVVTAHDLTRLSQIKRLTFIIFIFIIFFFFTFYLPISFNISYNWFDGFEVNGIMK
jgi:hypothetical protein